MFNSSASQRLTVAPLQIARVDAGGRTVTTDAQVQAETNGSVKVRAQLQTSNGTPVGRGKVVEITATQAGTIGWLIAIAAGIVLVGTTVLRPSARSARSGPPRSTSRRHSRFRDPQTRPRAGETTKDSLDV